MRIVAYTTPQTFKWDDRPFELPYHRIHALWQDDGAFGQHVGTTATKGLAERELNMPDPDGQRLLKVMREILRGEPGTCHDFSSAMADLPAGAADVLATLRHAQPATTLAFGKIGLVGAAGPTGVQHSIGYALEDGWAIQRMEAGGHPGIARTDDVLDFYRQLHPGADIRLYEPDLDQLRADLVVTQ